MITHINWTIIIILNRKIILQICKDNEIKHTKLKKETWIVCILVCMPVVAECEPFRDLPCKLP
jgi:hypothetical protein